jgi:pimeloyl-ACP methyl ester carboxylesterase
MTMTMMFNDAALADTTRRITLPAGAQVYVKAAPVSDSKGDVLYVHGATFPSDLSVFFKFEGRSWADALNEAGYTVWGFDFVGYGYSSRYEAGGTAPRGRADETLPQLLAVIEHIRSHNGAKKVSLIAHSWGTIVAARAAIAQPEWIDKLVMFGAPVRRDETLQTPALPPVRPINIWEQYRRFTEDVPRGHAPVLLDTHFDLWAKAYLATDLSSAARQPNSVMTPTGPIADLYALWQGQKLYETARIKQPLLLVRGEWDCVCNDKDAQRFMSELGSAIKRDVKILKGTHLMHLEESRVQLYKAANQFLAEQIP